LAFSLSGLASIDLPPSAEVICEFYFSDCKSFERISFGEGSKLSRIEREAFQESGLASIRLPASVEVIVDSCFSFCRSLQSVTFDRGSMIREWNFSKDFRTRFPMAFCDEIDGTGGEGAKDDEASEERDPP
jgi:hypothetical protein